VIKDSELLSERTSHQADRFTHLQMLLELQNSFIVRGTDKCLHDSIRHWMRLVAPHYQPGYPYCAVDTAPLVEREIENYEEISWKERRFDGLRHPCVPNRFEALWQERSKALIFEMPLGAQLGHRQ
jgi:hypothetical protein